MRGFHIISQVYKHKISSAAESVDRVDLLNVSAVLASCILLLFGEEESCVSSHDETP